MTTSERSVEEIVNEVIISVGRTGDVEGEIAKALQAERQKREEMVEAERERIEEVIIQVRNRTPQNVGRYAGCNEILDQLTQTNNPK